jgi:hypothetical protein
MLAVVTGAALAFAGCGSSDSSSETATAAQPAASAQTVNTTTVEQQIQTKYSSSTVKVTKVTCPSKVPVEKGGTFTCTMYLSNSGGGKVKVTQQGANRYSYEIVSGSVTVPGSSVDTQLEADLAKQGAPNANVTCPSTIVVKVGTTVTCNVTGASGGSGQVTFQFTSATGTIDTSSVNK